MFPRFWLRESLYTIFSSYLEKCLHVHYKCTMPDMVHLGMLSYCRKYTTDIEAMYIGFHITSELQSRNKYSRKSLK